MSEKKRSWKDSNWYVGLTGFWSEYRKHRIGIIGLVMLIVFVSTAIFAPNLATHDPTPSAKVAPTYLAPQWMSVFDPTGVITEQALPDPDLDETPTVIVPENRTEFTYQHFPREDNFSYVSLKWEHAANTTYNWRTPEDPTEQLSDCLDFIYVKQEFEWTYNNIPSDANFSVEYQLLLEGDFATEEIGGRMFEVLVWLIDSSGNWTRIYTSTPPYTPAWVERRADLSIYEVSDVWGGMIKPNDTADQQDPTDIITLAVGFSPKYRFRGIPYVDEPWTRYDGSVTLNIRHVKLIAYGEYFGILGTTDKGADAWSQLVYGSRLSLLIGVMATALSTGVGCIVGLIAGYLGGKVDEVIMRIVDFLLVVPSLPLMMVLAAFLGPAPENIILVIAILGWTGTSRLIRSQVLAEKNKAYVESARAIGASDTYIMFRHILPNVTPILFANITLHVVGAILSEAGLAFLGLTDKRQPSWGRMLADAREAGGFSQGAWWVVIFPGLMITMLSLAFTFIGHTLDQVFNPRLRER